MTLMRQCDSCIKPINQNRYLEVQLRVLRSHEDNVQDAIAQVYGDYCDECVTDGTAVRCLQAELNIVEVVKDVK